MTLATVSCIFSCGIVGVCLGGLLVISRNVLGAPMFAVPNPLGDAPSATVGIGRPEAPLPQNLPSVVEDLPAPPEAVPKSTHPWTEAFGEVGCYNKCSLCIWFCFVLGALILVFGGAAGDLSLIIVGAVFTAPCVISFLPWPLVFRLVGILGSEYNSGKGRVTARKVYLEEAEQILENIRSFEGSSDLQLRMNVECSHTERRGFGNDAVTNRIVSFSGSKIFRASARRAVVVDNQMYHSPLTSLEFVDHGVAFADRETRDAFIASWDAFYRENYDRDEDISMTHSISGGYGSPISERNIIVVADETFGGLRWYDSNLDGCSCVNFWACCGVFALCRARNTVHSRAELWTTITLRDGDDGGGDETTTAKRGKPGSGDDDAATQKMKASSSAAMASAPPETSWAPPPPPRPPTDIEMGSGTMAL